VRAFLIALAVLASLVPLWPVYQSPAVLLTVGAGAVLGAVLAVISARKPWSVLRTGLVTLAVYLFVGVPLAVPSAALFGVLPSLPGELSLLAGTVLSWKQLVTVMPPVGSYEALLVPALLLALVGMLVALRLALRKPASAWAALVPILTLAASVWLGSSRPFYSGYIALAVFALLALWFATARGSFARTSLRAVGIVLGASVIAWGAGALIPVTDRSVWRTQVEQPFVLRDATSPLSEYRTYVTGDQSLATLLSVQGLKAGEHLALATLDSYNGVVFSVGGAASDFTRMPGSIATAGQAGDEVRASVTIQSLTGPWVPLAGSLGAIKFTSPNARELTNAFYYSRPAATGALVSGVASGDAYSTTGMAAPSLTLPALSQLAPGTAIVPAPAVIPDGLDAFINANSKGGATAGARLQNVLQALVAKGYISHGGTGEVPSASGHGANRLSALFAANPMVGDAEQYAAAAALLATQVGFPARVVMGFVAPAGTGSTSTLALQGKTMTAWIEINTADGWVAVDPIPAVRPIPNKTPDDPTKVAFPQTAVEPPPADSSRISDAKAPTATDEQQPDVLDPFWAAVLGVVGFLGWFALWALILTSPLLLIEFAKRRRRAGREHAIGARDRTLGAWDALRDLLADHGQAVSAADTRREIAESAALPAARSLAVLADSAQYSGDGVTARDADQAWVDVRAAELEMDAALKLEKRLLARFQVRSFGLTRARLRAALRWPR
jgi:transglutaminase-like putative cysteine protease